MNKKIAIKFRVNAAELAAIHKAAGKKPVATFVRSKALARAAEDDVDYELGIIQQLQQVVQAMQDVQNTMLQTGIAPTESVWHPIMEEIQSATEKIHHI